MRICFLFLITMLTLGMLPSCATESGNGVGGGDQSDGGTGDGGADGGVGTDSVDFGIGIQPFIGTFDCDYSLDSIDREAPEPNKYASLALK